MDGVTHREYGEDGLPIGETPEQRAARIVREAEIVARAEKDFADGRFVEWPVARAWLESLDENPDALLPAPHR